MIQIVNIILVIIGLGLMFVKKISVSAQSEIGRPKTYIFGGLIIGLVVLANLISGMFEHNAAKGSFSTGWLLSYIIPLALIFVFIPFLKQPKAANESSQGGVPVRSGADKVANVITWIIFGAIGIGVLYFGYIMLQNR